MTAPNLTPSAGTGLAGSWHVSRRAGLALRADAPCGPIPGVMWDEDVSEEQWRELAALVWQADGRLRAGSRCSPWVSIGHVIAANGPAYPVVLSGWAAAVVSMPGALCTAVPEAGTTYVRVSLGGDLVAVVMARRVDVVRGAS